MIATGTPRSARSTMASGWMPMLLSVATECWVGLVLSAGRGRCRAAGSRARVDVQMRVELVHSDPQAPGLEQGAHAGDGEPLPSEEATVPVTTMCLVVVALGGGVRTLRR